MTEVLVLQHFRRETLGTIAAALERRGVALIDTVFVHLPPRRFPGLGVVFETPRVARTLDRFPRASLLVAHAVWLVGAKVR